MFDDSASLSLSLVLETGIGVLHSGPCPSFIFGLGCSCNTSMTFVNVKLGFFFLGRFTAKPVYLFQYWFWSRNSLVNNWQYKLM